MSQNAKKIKRAKYIADSSEKSPETDRLNIALQMIQVKKGPRCIKKISKATGISPRVIKKLISLYQLAKTKSGKSDSDGGIMSISDIKSDLKLEGSISDILCLSNDENKDNDEDKEEGTQIVFALVFL